MSDEEQKSRDAAEAERRKKEVGTAPYGTPQYWRNAAYVLSAYTCPNATTRAKLKSLDEHGY